MPTSVHYSYDRRGRLAAVGTEAERVRYATYEYGVDGAVLRRRTAGVPGADVDVSYDALARTVSIQSTALAESLGYRTSQAPLAPFGDGRIMVEVARRPREPASTAVHRYDAFGRLVDSQRDGTTTLAARYDANTNAIAWQAGAQIPSRLAYAAGSNRLERSDDRSLAYSPTGAVLRQGGTDFRYDPMSGSHRRIGGSTVSRLARNSEGRVVARSCRTSTRLYVPGDGLGPIVTADSNGQRIDYVAGADGLLTVLRNGAPYWVQTDVRGSICAVLAADGSPAAAFGYGPFGQQLVGVDEAEWLRQRFTAHELLADFGLYDFDARLYEPGLGRFLSPDSERETPNPYAYTAGDPVNFVDPDGRVIIAVLRRGNSNFLFATGMANVDGQNRLFIDLELRADTMQDLFNAYRAAMAVDLRNRGRSIDTYSGRRRSVLHSKRFEALDLSRLDYGRFSAAVAGPWPGFVEPPRDLRDVGSWIHGNARTFDFSLIRGSSHMYADVTQSALNRPYAREIYQASEVALHRKERRFWFQNSDKRSLLMLSYRAEPSQALFDWQTFALEFTAHHPSNFLSYRPDRDTRYWINAVRTADPRLTVHTAALRHVRFVYVAESLALSKGQNQAMRSAIRSGTKSSVPGTTFKFIGY